MRHVSPPVVIHENVVGIPLATVQEQLGEMYDLTPLSVTFDDAGLALSVGRASTTCCFCEVLSQHLRCRKRTGSKRCTC